MCMYCDAYGNPAYGDGVWYLNPYNYARQMYKVRKPEETQKGYEIDPETAARLGFNDALEVLYTEPEKFDEAIKRADDQMAVHTVGQVVPLQEAEKILDIAGPIAAMHCVCRKATRAREEDDPALYSCGGLGVGMLKWERWPERYKGGVDFMSPEKAKEWLRKWNQRGMVHTIMVFGPPYIGGLCNCDYPDCGAIRQRIDYDLPHALAKSHFVAKVDYDICNGCGVCVQRCQFGALKFEPTIERPNIDMSKCFGCGLCETGCPRDAITLIDKMGVPALREVW